MIKTKVCTISRSRPDPEAIRLCARVIRRGGLVALPTETVYGLAANFFDKAAVDRLYRIKQRPRSKPFTIQVADIEAIGKLGCIVTPKARRLMAHFWPGPLTVILRSASGEHMGFRIPRHNVALALIRRCRVPIVVPSANLSGAEPARDARGVLDSFSGKVEVVIDAGPAEMGIESTVVDLTGHSPRIVRRGAVSRSDIMRWYT